MVFRSSIVEANRLTDNIALAMLLGILEPEFQAWIVDMMQGQLSRIRYRKSFWGAAE
jgi:hypothetical protein